MSARDRVEPLLAQAGRANPSKAMWAVAHPSLYSNNSSRPSIAGRPLLFIGLAVVVLILVIVLAFALGGKDKQQEDIPSVPISGLTDTSNPETEQQVQQVDTPPTSVKVEYKVASGAEVYAEVNDNGTAESKMLTGRLPRPSRLRARGASPRG